MSIIYVDFKSSCRSISEARASLRSAEHSLATIDSLFGHISHYEW